MMYRATIRYAAAFAMLATAALTPRIASAAPAHPAAFPRLTATLFSRLAGNQSVLHSITRLHPRFPASVSQAASRDISDPTQLSLQWPANATNTTAGTVTAAQADDPDSNPFASLHSETYTAAGMQSGYLQTAHLPIGTVGDIALGYWLASIYSSDSAATAQVTETDTKLTGEGLKSVSCGATCSTYFIAFTVQGTNFVLVYTVLSDANVVAELGLVVTSQVAQNQSTQVIGLLNALAPNVSATVARAEGAAPTPTPTATTTTATPPTVTITGLGILERVKKTDKVVRKFPANRKVEFVAGFQYGNLQGQTPSTPTISFSVKGHAAGTHKMKFLDNTPSGVAAYVYLTRFATSKTTKVKALVTGRVGSVVAQKTITFTVTKK